MWGWGRPKRDIPQVNYAESSEEEENFEDGLTFNSPLISPQRPLPTREGSPVELAHPTLNDNVDETLEEVTYHLHDINQVKEDIDELADLLEDTNTKVGGDIVKVEEVLEFNFKVAADNNEVAADNNDMANDPIVDFEDEDGVDDARALQEAIRALERLQWEDDDIDFYFNQAEIKMAAHGVKKNYTKFQVLATVIPSKITLQIKSLLRKKESEYPDKNAYKLLKTEIFRIFGPKPEAGLEKALTRVLIDTPSALARTLVNDVCKTELQGCTCCPGIVTGLWKRQLPSNVTSGIAGKTLNKDNFNEVCQLADDIYTSNSNKPTMAAVTSQSLNETQPALPYPVQAEVNAVRSSNRGGRGRGRGRGGRGNQRGGRGGQSNGSRPSSGTSSAQPKHPDLPPGEWSGCSMHRRHGRGAYFCSEPATCPWKDIFTPKPK